MLGRWARSAGIAISLNAFALAGTSLAGTESARRESQIIQDTISASPNKLDNVAAFYAQRDGEPFWTGSEDAEARARIALEQLGHAGDQGLVASDYLGGLKSPSDGSADSQARFDIALTTAVLRYANDAVTGRVEPARAYRDAQLPPHIFAGAGRLRSARSADALADFFAELHPENPAYAKMTDALARYRAVAAPGGWKRISPGASSAELAKRLVLEDPQLAALPSPSSQDLADALRRYQARNGLTPGDALDAVTVAALNVPAAWRARQIVANLERMRWLPEKFEKRYIVVNVPDQSVDFVQRGRVVLHSPVVIGKPQTPTPILRTEVQAVVANPPWDIPDFIAAKQLLPHLRKDRRYLETRNIVLADGPEDDPHGTRIDWRKVTINTIPFQIQQLPGPDNALGALMLDMPNDFDVYLHDTPSKQFFALDDREKSNGCVRVQQIFPLASLVLTGDAEDGLDDLITAVKSGQTQRFALRRPIPVYMFYWTAIVQPDGTIGFRPDRYGRDRQLLALLEAKSTPDAPRKTRAPRTTRISALGLPKKTASAN